MHEQTRSIMEYIADTYGAEVEYPWAKSANGIWRNPRTRKWFAVLLSDLPLRCLGLETAGTADVLNLKCDPNFSMVDHRHIFRAYHMNKEHWSMVTVGGDANEEHIMQMIYDSYKLTAKKGTKK